MLETLRQYAEERLRASREYDELRRRHARYFHNLCLASETEPRGHHRDAMLRLREEQPDLRAALAWRAGEAKIWTRRSGPPAPLPPPRRARHPGPLAREGSRITVISFAASGTISAVPKVATA
jgi:hypothetical protein